MTGAGSDGKRAGGGQVLVEVGVGGEEEVQGGGFREAGEVRVVAPEEFDGGHFAGMEQAAAVGLQPLGDARQDLDSDAAVIEPDAGDDLPDRLLRGGACPLQRAAVGNGDVSAELFVDGLHPRPEKAAVRRRVLLLLRQDFIVDHLVEQDVFQLTFGKIVLCADPDAEIVVFDFPEQEPPFFVGTGAQAAHGAAQPERNRRERISEAGVVKRFETALEERNRRNHRLKNTNNRV